MDENTGSGPGRRHRMAPILGMRSHGAIAFQKITSQAIALLTVLAVLSLASCQSPSNTEPDIPGGGQEYVLDQDLFDATVAPVFTAKGCDTIECHGGGFRGTFALSPLEDKNLEFEFAQASLQVDGDEPAASPLLLKPLAEDAGGVAHASDPAQHGFTSTDDPGYQAILLWIEAGEYR